MLENLAIIENKYISTYEDFRKYNFIDADYSRYVERKIAHGGHPVLR
nr:hypothetical protein [Anaerococcus prevotii]